MAPSDTPKHLECSLSAVSGVVIPLNDGLMALIGQPKWNPVQNYLQYSCCIYFMLISFDFIVS